jgi:hypothetical protein
LEDFGIRIALPYIHSTLLFSKYIQISSGNAIQVITYGKKRELYHHIPNKEYEAWRGMVTCPSHTIYE